MERKKVNPGTVGAARGVRDASRIAKQSQHTTAEGGKATITVRCGKTQRTLHGREAQTLALLIENGPRGFTSGEASPLGWARRTSHYIHKLRTAGFSIETHQEKAGDALIGRYVLTQPVTVVGRTAK